MCFLKTRHCLVAALCMLSPLFCAAQEPAVSHEVSYLSFQVPGALGTYPMSVNSTMAVTGYYYVSSTVTGGFLHDAGGAITTFSVRDGLWTEPESINDAGDITGFYEVVAGVPQGFLRYADGRIVTFEPPTSRTLLPQAQPVSINAFDKIAGNYPFPNPASIAGFTRSRAGVFTTIGFGDGGAYSTVVTGLNASGTVVGYGESDVDLFSFISDPDGASTLFALPKVGGECDNYRQSTVAETINADGVIAGLYSLYIDPCVTMTVGGFVRSPQGVFTLFSPPGTIVTLPVEPGLVFGGETLTPPHQLSINQAGTITGSYVDAEGAKHGFVRNPYGTITSFDPPRGRQTTATSINDCGVIVGSYYYDWNNQIAEGFLRVPQP